jgi:hypothetical protein
MYEKLKEIKTNAVTTKQHDFITEIPYEDFEWLIQQAEQLQKIKMLSNAEELTVADFGLDVLRIIENREIQTRKRMI